MTHGRLARTGIQQSPQLQHLTHYIICQAHPLWPKVFAVHISDQCTNLSHLVVRRGAAVVSHLSPRVTQAVWVLCWGLTLLQRTSFHPPAVMLQDLQVPSQDHNSNSLVSVHSKPAETVCLSLAAIAVGHNVLCIGLWPRPTGTAEDLAGGEGKMAAVKC